MQARIFHLHALSALHCGTGQSAGVVDLPIARARATQLPIVPGSSTRGVLRETITGTDPKAADSLFGPALIRANEDAFAGALAVGDAHLLLLPVRSLGGIVCYATAPFILRRYARDLARAGETPPPVPGLGAKALIPESSVNPVNDKLVLEDLDLDAKKDPSAKRWAEAIAQTLHPNGPADRGDLIARFAILPDDVLGFLAETATEIRTRIAIDPGTGTVKKGALWYEENLPAETVLWGIYALAAPRNRDDERDADQLATLLPTNEDLLQLGGKAGVGRGLVRFLIGRTQA